MLIMLQFKACALINLTETIKYLGEKIICPGNINDQPEICFKLMDK